MRIGEDNAGNPIDVAFPPQGWFLAFFRFVLIAVIAASCLLVNLVVRTGETAFTAPRQPVSMYVTQFFARLALLVMGMRCEKRGEAMNKPGAVVSNHLSWIDIMPLLHYQRVLFLAKREVKFWPLIGQMAWAAGTLFIRRERGDSRQQKNLFEKALEIDEKIIFFPEGHSNGMRVLPFKSTLFSALFSSKNKDDLYVQPVTLVYITKGGADTRIYCWGLGNTSMLRSLIFILGQFRQAQARLIFSEPLKVADFPDRKALAAATEAIIRENFEANVEYEITPL